MTASDPELRPRLPGEGVKKAPLSQRARRGLYKRQRSFVDFLPWVEYLPAHQAILLADGVSVGAVLEVLPAGTEGRSPDYLAELRDTLQDALQDSFDEHDQAPWVLQSYTFDEPDLDRAMDAVSHYPARHIRDTAYTRAYLELMARHYQGISKPGGLFYDGVVTQTDWGGAVRRNLLMLYRKHPAPKGRKARSEAGMDRETALLELADTVDKFTQALNAAGVGLKRLSGTDFHDWLLGFFNEGTDLFGGDTKAFLRAARHDEDTLPVGDRFTETLFYEHPRSDQAGQCWWFGNSALRCLSIDGLRRRPQVGQVTGEITRGDATHTLIDVLPPGSVFVTTMVVIPQDSLEAHIQAIDASAIGEGSESAQVRKDCGTALEILAERHKFYRAQYAVYLRGSSVAELNERSTALRARLLNVGFRAIAPKDDFTALDAAIRNLPMVYDPALDAREGWRGAQITLVQHMANLSCFFGRNRGTGHPGLALFNRGGEPMFFDPLNPADRQKNAHMLILGPTGAGKSASVISMLAHVMAMHRPRLFIIEAGNSFGLLGQWFASLGLSVNQVSLKPGSGVALSPFADAHRLLQGGVLFDPLTAVEAGDDEEEPRDIMGELEIVALLMITGGEEREAREIRRADRSMIRRAILAAAERAQAADRPTLTEDVREAFFVLAESARTDAEAGKLRNMGQAIDMYCHAFNGEVFNTVGDPWPEADVTIIDLATFAREGYEANLAISVISCLNRINHIAERDQFTDREIVVTIDEAHIITTNPLLAPFLVKIVKMWRKLGAWLWSATQNMADYPDAARRMLNTVEWWLCLVMPKEEVEALEQYRQLHAGQRSMLLSASKAPGQYTEGVLMSEQHEYLVRNVPPSLMLALAQTEKHEKAQRNALMREHGCSELEAAMRVAAEIDRMRGISDDPQ
ncbi:conjugative transfer ATPase [Haliea salexigens]|uniref:conjugative transfer ATPase n=1 Tax=Haliea salexigens TaxID=287487 RepID=UPI0004137DC7|nr:conjugative transfer ATPase [Haliea salexigens]|tara:strand:+ start:8839 stop:11589 length:2751 start_codon:yes stop_codon:yes gene_type:complete